ncbi:MAG TPA: hypothetical protein VI756_16010, partial [Blastocatellia bacterium]
RCRKVHLISHDGKPNRIRYDRIRREFSLTCVPPCCEVTYFQKRMLKPYSVSADVLDRGHADFGECRPIADIKSSKADSQSSAIKL